MANFFSEDDSHLDSVFANIGQDGGQGTLGNFTFELDLSRGNRDAGAHGAGPPPAVGVGLPVTQGAAPPFMPASGAPGVSEPEISAADALRGVEDAFGIGPTDPEPSFSRQQQQPQIPPTSLQSAPSSSSFKSSVAAAPPPSSSFVGGAMGGQAGGPPVMVSTMSHGSSGSVRSGPPNGTAATGGSPTSGVGGLFTIPPSTRAAQGPPSVASGAASGLFPPSGGAQGGAEETDEFSAAMSAPMPSGHTPTGVHLSQQHPMQTHAPAPSAMAVSNSVPGSGIISSAPSVAGATATQGPPSAVARLHSTQSSSQSPLNRDAPAPINSNFPGQQPQQQGIPASPFPQSAPTTPFPHASPAPSTPTHQSPPLGFNQPVVPPVGRGSSGGPPTAPPFPFRQSPPNSRSDSVSVPQPGQAPVYPPAVPHLASAGGPPGGPLVPPGGGAVGGGWAATQAAGVGGGSGALPAVSGATIAFGFGGKLFHFRPAPQPQGSWNLQECNNECAVWSLSSVLKETVESEAPSVLALKDSFPPVVSASSLEGWPGPLGHVDVKLTDALREFMENRVRSLQQAGEGGGSTAVSNRVGERLLWTFLLGTLECHGKAVHHQIALMLKDPLMEVQKKIRAKRERRGERPSGREGSIRGVFEPLTRGNAAEAVASARAGGFWAHALLLSSLESPQAYGETVSKFVQSEVQGGGVETQTSQEQVRQATEKRAAGMNEWEAAEAGQVASILFMLVANKAPLISDEILLCWPLLVLSVYFFAERLMNLPAAWASQLSPQASVEAIDFTGKQKEGVSAFSACLVRIGDALLKAASEPAGAETLLASPWAAHLCFLLAGIWPGSIDSQTSRIVLIGANHRHPSCFGRLSDPLHFQMTETLEYAVRHFKSQFFFPSLQPFRLLYAGRLSEFGLFSKASRYCQFTTAFMRTMPAPAVPDQLKLLLRETEMRIKEHKDKAAGPSSSAGQTSSQVGSALSSLWGGLKNVASSFASKDQQHQQGGPSGRSPGLDHQPSAVKPPPLAPAVPGGPPVAAAAQGQMPVPQPQVQQQQQHLQPQQQPASPVPSGGSESGAEGGGLFSSLVGGLKKAITGVQQEREVGVENKYYFDKAKQRWVMEGEEDEVDRREAAAAAHAQHIASLPPPPTAAPVASAGAGAAMLTGAGGAAANRYVDVLSGGGPPPSSAPPPPAGGGTFVSPPRRPGAPVDPYPPPAASLGHPAPAPGAGGAYFAPPPSGGPAWQQQQQQQGHQPPPVQQGPFGAPQVPPSAGAPGGAGAGGVRRSPFG
uniref:Sec16 Sec23-binding domain-containing protein n=1 Tax=Chromera velia CCMP2878 TaxID=1169474 RepID=A0A0G4FCG7_9ALVE|eukprot:Cvel_16365.t1-p1 / transcript=Cvel_16365.t1 / gene=Cvel_16365 / organism=Chromera_velia_CCMP2878 / gene_product=Protein transport protein Sec16A, putative / transcript_product=Protein transport protein Sec16A, putative / location=Cvel_scaffold1257:36155-44048(-) / protein_length=1277 / sequence_SO=supercontig / SO=protein_coding / is_pseudo=false